MKENKLMTYKFKASYKFLNNIYDAVENEFDFWDFDLKQFGLSATKFNKKTLLHIYVSSTLKCYYRQYFHDNMDCIEEKDIDWWINIMQTYGINITVTAYDETQDEAALIWYQENRENFEEFFEKISDELVYILFNDKIFLVNFNKLVRKELMNEDYQYMIEWPEGTRNEDGTIIRCSIPQWVKNAVFHRDKGRCVFCNKDLTGLVNTLNATNYDHIIPLKNYGTNDPCNIQLTCEECNKSKGAKEKFPIYRFQTWW